MSRPAISRCSHLLPFLDLLPPISAEQMRQRPPTEWMDLRRTGRRRRHRWRCGALSGFPSSVYGLLDIRCSPSSTPIATLSGPASSPPTTPPTTYPPWIRPFNGWPLPHLLGSGCSVEIHGGRSRRLLHQEIAVLLMVVVLLAVGLQPLLLMVLRPAAAPPPPTSQTQQIEVAWPEQPVHLMAARREGRRAGKGRGTGRGRRRGWVKKGSSGSGRGSRSWGWGKTKVEGEDGSFVLNIGWSALWFQTRDAARELD